jgi:protein TonB
LDREPTSSFWKWVLLIALLHVAAIVIIALVFEFAPAPKPPEEFISLLPPGETVKGAPGRQEAHKLGASIPTVVHHSAPPPSPAATPPPVPPTPKVVQPTPPNPTPVAKVDATSLIPDQPMAKPPPKPAPPKPPKPKVKVDLHLVDAPDTSAPTPVKHHPRKTVEKPDDNPDAETPDVIPLSKAMVAAKLGEKLDSEGVKDAAKTGASGALDGHTNPFQEFYALLHDQVMQLWRIPNQIDVNAVEPIVEIHVEKNGYVPPAQVYLKRSSGNPAYDDSALQAAKNLNYLREPLPDGCPPDISITFEPNT